MKKLFLILLTALAFTSCGDNEEHVVSYTVTFEADGGSPVPSAQRVEEGNAVTAPSVNPAKAGYVFLFWHLSNSTTAYNFQTPVQRDLTLYAGWQEETTVEYWQVTWTLNGGTWPSDDNHATQVVKNGTLSEPNAPSKANNTFDGWYKEVALTNKVLFPYDVSAVTANFTLFAKWKEDDIPADKSVVMTASGHYTCFRVSADGSLSAVGRNEYGQLGAGHTDDLHSQTQVATDVAKVYAGKHTTFMLKTDGSLLGTGLNLIAQLGLGDETNRNSFTPIPVTDVKEVAPGSFHTHLLKNDGSLWATGSNGYGQLGLGDQNQRTVFTPTSLGSDVVAVAAGSEHSLALKKDGTVWGTGYGYVGTFGGEESYSTFTQLFSGAKGIAACAYHSLVLMNDGTVYGSGINSRGQLGVGNYSEYVNSFTQAIDDTGAPLTNVTAIVTGPQSTFAFKSDGTLWAAGNNNYGQLGMDHQKNCSGFTQVAVSGIQSISAGSIQSASIERDNSSRIYGSINPNPYAQLEGSGTIVVEYNSLISRIRLNDHSNSTNIFEAFKECTISVKPGIYNLSLTTQNNGGVTTHFVNYPVSSNETLTFTYEFVSIEQVYRWVIKRSVR